MNCFTNMHNNITFLCCTALKKMSSVSGTIANAIKSKLQTALETKHLEIINESYMHNVPKGAETHFKVVVVSDKFDGLALIKVSGLKTTINSLLGLYYV